MAFNPKGASLKDINPKDVSKKAIDKLSKKYNSPTKMAPFFIKVDHTFGDGSTGPLFMFGKLTKFKKEIKDMKGATELHGLAYVELDAKGTSTLCLAPAKGKLDGKLPLLTKAMKTAFTNAYANFKIVDPVSEDQLAAMEAAAEAEGDEAEDDDANVKSEAPAKPDPKANANAAADEAKNIISQAISAVKADLANAVANVKAQKVSDADLKAVAGVASKIQAAQSLFAGLPAMIQQALKSAYDSVVAQLPTVEKVKAAIEKALASGGKPEDKNAKELTPEQKAALEKAFSGMVDTVKGVYDKYAKSFDKSAEDIKSAPSPKAKGGKELIDAMF